MNIADALRLSMLCAATTAAMSPAPASALNNTLSVHLIGHDSHLREAAATIFGSGSNVLVDVTRYRAVADGAAVTLNKGLCSNPGAVAFKLSPFAKYGSVTELRHALSDVTARARSMVIHQTSSDMSPAFACGEIPK
jgi:hypothetical protein